MEELILRMMAWERAKGELRSMLQSYVNDMEKFRCLQKTIEEFIKDVEYNGKHE
jgi:hypothetical protein